MRHMITRRLQRKSALNFLNLEVTYNVRCVQLKKAKRYRTLWSSQATRPSFTWPLSYQVPIIEIATCSSKNVGLLATRCCLTSSAVLTVKTVLSTPMVRRTTRPVSHCVCRIGVLNSCARLFTAKMVRIYSSKHSKLETFPSRNEHFLLKDCDVSCGGAAKKRYGRQADDLSTTPSPTSNDDQAVSTWIERFGL